MRNQRAQREFAFAKQQTLFLQFTLFDGFSHILYNTRCRIPPVPRHFRIQLNHFIWITVHTFHLLSILVIIVWLFSFRPSAQSPLSTSYFHFSLAVRKRVWDIPPLKRQICSHHDTIKIHLLCIFFPTFLANSGTFVCAQSCLNWRYFGFCKRIFETNEISSLEIKRIEKDLRIWCFEPDFFSVKL